MSLLDEFKAKLHKAAVDEIGIAIAADICLEVEPQGTVAGRHLRRLSSQRNARSELLTEYETQIELANWGIRKE